MRTTQGEGFVMYNRQVEYILSKTNAFPVEKLEKLDDAGLQLIVNVVNKKR